MNYEYVKATSNGFEFIGDDGYQYMDIIYNSTFLGSMTPLELDAIGLKKTVLIPPPANALDSDGTMYFNEVNGIVEYRPNYTIGVRVPQVITMRQAKLALLHSGLLDDIELAITSGSDRELQIEWNSSSEVQRAWPSLVAIATTLNISSTQLDDLFILGATL